MTIPLVNSTLTRIAGTGASEDYGSAGGPEVVRFSGSASAYLTDRTVSVPGQSLNQIDEDILVVDYDLGKLVKQEDKVSFTTDGVAHTRKVRDVQRYMLFGTARIKFYDQ